RLVGGLVARGGRWAERGGARYVIEGAVVLAHLRPDRRPFLGRRLPRPGQQAEGGLLPAVDGVRVAAGGERVGGGGEDAGGPHQQFRVDGRGVGDLPGAPQRRLHLAAGDHGGRLAAPGLHVVGVDPYGRREVVGGALGRAGQQPGPAPRPQPAGVVRLPRQGPAEGLGGPPVLPLAEVELPAGGQGPAVVGVCLQVAVENVGRLL